MPTAPPAPHPIAALYADHNGWLQNWLRRQLGCSERAADLAHDTFVRLLAPERRAPAPESLKAPRAYLATIARGLVVNHWRRLDVERAWLDTLAAQPQAFAPSPEERALVIEALCALDALLDRLNPKARQAFLLAQLDGLTYGEIGRTLAVSERMVKKYMAQAMLHCLQADLLPA